MPEKMAFIVVKLLPEAAEKSNAELEKEISEAVESVMPGYLPYKKEIVKVTVINSA